MVQHLPIVRENQAEREGGETDFIAEKHVEKTSF